MMRWDSRVVVTGKVCAMTTTYAVFKAKIIRMYPGSIHNSNKYTLAELETLVEICRSMPMKSCAKLGA
jgi:hypothetical protein